MKNEFLVGGASPSGTRSSRILKMRRPSDSFSAPPVGVGFLAVLMLIGGAFVGLGVWRVHTVFDVRDYEIETGRLQSIAQERNDRYQSLTARAAHLRAAESLKLAAVDSLGMTAPDPSRIETLTVSAETTSRWKKSAANLRVESLEKEDAK
ncbi:hypothetical protein BH09SUM1_BH09SUM1_12070 [soil metagenome]